MKKALLLVFILSIAFAQLPEYRLARGWNMIGGASSTFPASDLDTFSVIIPPIYFYNPSTSIYEEADSIKPLYGYWIMSRESLIVIMDSDTCDCPPTVTDIDGNSYETILIGTQCWMKENLKTTHYRDGTPIPTGFSAPEWENLDDTETGAYAEYNDDPSNVATYGRLYNWYAVDDARELCPSGWHVPTDEEWKTLEMYLGMSETEADAEGWRGTNEGSKLAGRADLWSDGALEADPEFGTSGFTALPGGYRSDDGSYLDMPTTRTSGRRQSIVRRVHGTATCAIAIQM